MLSISIDFDIFTFGNPSPVLDEMFPARGHHFQTLKSGALALHLTGDRPGDHLSLAGNVEQWRRFASLVQDALARAEEEERSRVLLNDQASTDEATT